MMARHFGGQMPDPDCLAAAALALVGTPFRLHGRQPETGLDCVGLVSASLTATGRRPIAPSGYGLRNLSVDQWLFHAEQSGLVRAPGTVRAGDVLLLALDHGQFHLMIAVGNQEAVHAHAGLRRVVRQRFDSSARISAKWCLPSSVERLG